MATVCILLFGGAELAYAQTPAPAAAPPEKALQSSGCNLLYKFSMVDCMLGPASRWASNAMLSMGGALLKFSGAIFDFAVNHAIINFKDTLQQGNMNLMQIINNGWTFFRDIANIIMIGMFVFIAMSLILGLREYGQKKLIARVLIIAVLMNFSLLFTKIIIDASNFMAYAIYSQTAGAAGAGKNVQPFSTADKILAPLHITGVWDTSKIASGVYAEPNGGGITKALFFGLLGFLLLALLAMIIFYGAFLIIARAILFIVLMLSAPLAYVTYLAPNLEGSQFGWSNWWKSLINNAAFAPLLMVFLSISILIFQTAGPSLGANNTIGGLIADPQKQVLADGWRVLFVYFLGTGLLFISFRLSSSLAGSISGVKFGQMAAGLPLAFGTRGAARLAQLSAGRLGAKFANNRDGKMQAAKERALNSSNPNDQAKAWSEFEKMRKQKAVGTKLANSSFNPMNTGFGKAAAGTAGLAGVAAGEKKGSFAGDAHDRAVALEKKAKEMQLTEADKNKLRKEARSDVENTNTQNAETAKKNAEAAKVMLDNAHAEAEALKDPKHRQDAERQSAEKAPALDAAQREVEVHETTKKQIESAQPAIDVQLQKAQQQAPGEERDSQIRAVAKRQAEHNEELQKQEANITAAKKQVERISTEIRAPLKALDDLQLAAAKKINERIEENRQAETMYQRAKEVAATPPREGEINKRYQEKLTDAQKSVSAGVQQVIQRDINVRGGGDEAKHIMEHHLGDKYKQRSSAENLREEISKLNKSNKADGGAAH